MAAEVSEEQVAVEAPEERVAAEVTEERVAVEVTEEQVAVEVPEEQVAVEAPEEQVAVETSQHSKNHQLSKQQGPPQPDTEQTVQGPQVPDQALFCLPTRPSPCTHSSSKHADAAKAFLATDGRLRQATAVTSSPHHGGYEVARGATGEELRQSTADQHLPSTAFPLPSADEEPTAASSLLPACARLCFLPALTSPRPPHRGYEGAGGDAEKADVERAAAEATAEKADVERAAVEATAEKADVESAAAEATAETADVERAAA